MSQQMFTFVQEVTTHVTLNYLLHLPPSINNGAMHPLIVYLHGSGKRGSDPNLIKTNGLPKILEDQPDFPFVVLSPQCPTNRHWVFLAVEFYALLNDILNRYPVDSLRVYLTGLSMGGTGTWHFAAHAQGYFAAIAPLCADGYRRLAERLTHTPIWAFHGELDDVVPVERTKTLVETVNQLGGEARLTTYPDLKHEIDAVTYANPDLYTWFLQYQL